MKPYPHTLKPTLPTSPASAPSVNPVNLANSSPDRSRRTIPAWGWWLMALSYFVVGSLMHLRFSLWLVRQRDTLLGNRSYSELVPYFAVAGGSLLLVWLCLQLRRHHRPWLVCGYWVLWFAAAVAIDRYLTFSINEYAHYPQYALLAWLLARAMDPNRQRWMVARVLFWTTLMGMGDEVLQYLWITTTYSDYLDFNDFIVNLIAAAAGVLLYYGPAAVKANASHQPNPPAGKPWVELAVAGSLVLVVLIALQTGQLAHTPANNIAPGGIARLADGSWRLYMQRGPSFYGTWLEGKRHGRYFVMPPIPGLLIMLCAGLAFASCVKLRPAPDT